MSIASCKVKKSFLFLLLLAFGCVGHSQNFELFEKFYGNYDYLSFGNTLNLTENGVGGACDIVTSSAADFQLQTGQNLIAAYLYWGGSGSGDLEVTLQGTTVTSERTFSFTNNGLPFFAARADVTTILASVGNDTYTLSDLDLTDVIDAYCDFGLNYGGWAVTVVYEDLSLPLNEVNIFEGFDGVSEIGDPLDIILNDLNVVDNTGAKIGFLAWDGDAGIAVSETLSINGNIIGNPPLNPIDNAFNGTNSFTNSDTLYNMDIDFYNIEAFINPGDTSASIRLTSNQDFVLVNNIVTVLNVISPDAVIAIDSFDIPTDCGDRDFTLDYTVSNIGTDIMMTDVPIAFYADDVLVAQSMTTMQLGIGESESGTINFTVPLDTPADFTFRAVVDDDGTGNGIENETDEDNNEATQEVHIAVFPVIPSLTDLEECEVVGPEFFDLTLATTAIDPDETITFHLSATDATNGDNAIINPTSYPLDGGTQTIWVRADNLECFVTDSFELEVVICPLPDATISIDNDINACRFRASTIDYTVYNLESTDVLPANTPIAFYADGILFAQAQTIAPIPIDGSESNTVEVIWPLDLPETFSVTASVDDDGTGMEVVEEENELNNLFEVTITYQTIDPIEALPNIIRCDEGNDTATFNLTQQNDLISDAVEDTITYYIDEIDAFEGVNPITDPAAYQNIEDPQLIYVRLENALCFENASFSIGTENCAPIIPEGFSPNGDGINDVFEIPNLLDVYKGFNLKVFSRNGNLIYEGGNDDGYWNGIPNRGILGGSSEVPVGTYYYVLQVNVPEFPKPFIGWVYVNY
ncbi:gliding motility-associated C-terminal domain-containing protein [Altibacter sp. HG106]|uniref:T9SS type B sorting domain-containing protein n=1 Tax=Altibacter sp. HG106 TaxID=3023937 RepID=UPI002350A967|nr:gliding motility-associated C-terminal domain-containing protein [Altibacter sp. HG106]MDC7993969.1 gliding motility-associated C-terminal domain-containing protein [Altibacter sp. HG106]